MWFAHVTVANVVFRDGKFLMVKEYRDGELVINQPAGHLEDNETLIEALIRETLEETQWKVKPIAALGISQFTAKNGDTYIRHSFVSEALELDTSKPIDQDIVEVCWMSAEEIRSHARSSRSPLVLNDVMRFQSGAQFPIDDLYFNAPK
jgi:8-oxo-dGTP pyrophosphatase MutT (NUDIX family)